MSDSIICAYEEAFPDSKVCFLMPSGELSVVDLENNREHLMPEEETEETFMDRIHRSQAQGRNLFFEEWHEYIHEWETDPDVIL